MSRAIFSLDCKLSYQILPLLPATVKDRDLHPDRGQRWESAYWPTIKAIVMLIPGTGQKVEALIGLMSLSPLNSSYSPDRTLA